MNVKERFNDLQTRIDELSLRERGILFLVIAIIIYMVVDTALIAPQEAKQKKVLSEINTLRSAIRELDQQQLDIINQHRVDPNAAELRLLEQLKQQSVRIDNQIETAVDGLIAPAEMARALEQVLKNQKQLSFVRVENLGAKPLLETTTSETSVEETLPSSQAGIYKHTMRIELEGSFHNTQRYLEALEQLPWKFHWESVQLTMKEYPITRVVITVNTLSLDEGWVGV